MSVSVRRLTVADWAAYRALRLEALTAEPTAFTSDHAREVVLAESAWAERLTESHVLGAFVADHLVGTATFFVEGLEKARHRGHVVGVYLRPEARGQGAGRAMLEAIIAEARGKVAQLHLGVRVGNDSARRLYESVGFTVYGVDPRALRVDGRYYDEHLMVLRLDAGGMESDER